MISLGSKRVWYGRMQLALPGARRNLQACALESSGWSTASVFFDGWIKQHRFNLMSWLSQRD